MLGPRLVHGALAFWMQTTGATLIAVERCTLVRMWMSAQDSRGAHALLYLAAVRDDGREQGHRQDQADVRGDCYSVGYLPLDDQRSEAFSPSR